MFTLSDIQKHSIPEPNSGCWLWTGEINAAGYGRLVKGNSRYGKRVRPLAHRVSFELEKGPIPAGKELDHLCRTPCCVNPAHLEPVTRAENTRRGDLMKRRGVRVKTHCINGHALPLAEFLPDGRIKSCPQCRRDISARYRRKLK